jgi:hypothetical protein
VGQQVPTGCQASARLLLNTSKLKLI